MCNFRKRLPRLKAGRLAVIWLIAILGMLLGPAQGWGQPSDQAGGENGAPTSIPLPGGVQAIATGQQVDINNFDFSPMSLTIEAGARVTWTNHDDIPHTVVSSDNPPVFKSPPLDTDDAFSVTFAKPGTYTYFCSVHPKMVGTIIVRAK